MRTIEKKVYTVDELSDEAKEFALGKYNEHNDWVWGHEAIETLKVFENIFPIKVSDYSIGSCQSSITWDFDIYSNEDEIADLSGVRLAAYIWNNYRGDIFKGKYYHTSKVYEGLDHNRLLVHKRVKSSKLKSKSGYFNAYHSAIQLTTGGVLTGVCFDDDILDPIYKFLDKPSNHVNFRDLIEECMDSFIKSCESDIEYNYSMESFVDSANANDWEFYEDGTMV